jgi:hypothetical protein
MVTSIRVSAQKQDDNGKARYSQDDLGVRNRAIGSEVALAREVGL